MSKVIVFIIFICVQYAAFAENLFYEDDGVELTETHVFCRKKEADRFFLSAGDFRRLSSHIIDIHKNKVYGDDFSQQVGNPYPNILNWQSEKNPVKIYFFRLKSSMKKHQVLHLLKALSQRSEAEISEKTDRNNGVTRVEHGQLDLLFIPNGDSHFNVLLRHEYKWEFDYGEQKISLSPEHHVSTVSCTEEQAIGTSAFYFKDHRFPQDVVAVMIRKIPLLQKTTRRDNNANFILK